jgi:hypothetical protein
MSFMVLGEPEAHEWLVREGFNEPGKDKTNQVKFIQGKSRGAPF